MPDRIQRLPEVMQTTGLGRTQLYNLINEGRFPRPVKLSARAVGWRESDIQAWIENRPTSDEVA
jgi:prophage regulatory protein